MPQTDLEQHQQHYVRYRTWQEGALATSGLARLTPGRRTASGNQSHGISVYHGVLLWFCIDWLHSYRIEEECAK